MTERYYKVLQDDGKTRQDGAFRWSLPRWKGPKSNGRWIPGDWMPVVENPVLCQRGYHACTREQVIEFLNYGLHIYVVELRGTIIHGSNKVVASEARVSGKARVSGEAQVSGKAWVSGEARVSGEAWVSGEARVLQVGPVGSRGAMLTIYPEKDRVVCTTGCFKNKTLAELLAACAETHGPDSPHTRDYTLLATAAFAVLEARIADANSGGPKDG